ncbi:hypothetical protein NOCA1130261 [metagenome]|uniref:Uncharacterized protein n=1 Tax=metagenome TaxID=256318 RepID=A0A2P2CAE5_9ZZZZ
MPGERRDVGLLGGLAAQRVPLVVQPDHGSAEVDVEGLRRGAADVEPAQHRRLEDAQRVGRGGHAAGRGRHLLDAGEPDEGVDHAGRGAPVEDRGDQLGADGVGRPGRHVVAAGRLEVHRLEGPAHRPVDLPHQLAVGVGREVGGALVAAGRAGVGQRRGGVVVRRGGDGVAAALAAVGPVGEARDRVGGGARAGVALLVVLVGDRVGQVRRLLGGRILARGDLLRAVLGQHGLDLVAARDRQEDLVAVGAGGVHLRLGDLLHLHAQLAQRLLQRCLEVLGPARVALPRVGHGGERAPDVLGPLRGDTGRHLAEAVEVVPRVQVAHRDAAAPQLLGDEVRGDELAQVAQVDRAAGGGAGRDGDRVALTGVAYGVVRRARHPVDRIALSLLSTSCHARKANGARGARRAWARRRTPAGEGPWSAVRWGSVGVVPRGDSDAVLPKEPTASHTPARDWSPQYGVAARCHTSRECRWH